MSIDLVYFIQNQLPWVVIGLFFVVILSIYLRDRWNKTLALHSSKEEKALKRLLEDGKISLDEYQDLSSSCNSLPEVEEVAPIPNIHLRLLVISGKIYSVLLFIGSLTILLALWLTAKSGFSPTVIFNIFVIIFAIILSVVLFFALGRILKGSLSARILVVIMLFLCMFMPIELFGVCYLSTMVAGYATFVLAFKDLKRGLLANIMCGVYIILLFSVSDRVAFKAARDNNSSDIHALVSYSGVAVYSNGFAKIEKINFIAGASDRDTQKVTKAIADKLTKKIGIPCEFIAYGEQLLNVDCTREITLIVIRDSSLNPTPVDENIVDFRGVFNGNMVKQTICRGLLGNSTTFIIRPAHEYNISSRNLNFIANYDLNGSIHPKFNENCNDIADRVVNFFDKDSFDKYQQTAVTIPDLVWQENNSALLNLPLADWRLVAESQIARVYSFRNRNSLSEKITLVSELEKLGYQDFSYVYRSGDLDLIYYKEPLDGISLVGIPDGSDDYSQAKYTTPECYVIQTNLKNRVDNEEYIKALEDGNVSFFVLNGSLPLLDTQEERIATYREFIQATSNQLILRLKGFEEGIENIDSEEFLTQEFIEICQAIKQVEELEELNEIFSKIEDIIELDARYVDIITTQLSQNVKIFELDADSTEEYHFKIEVDKLEDCFRVVYLKFKDDKYYPLQIYTGFRKGPNGEYYHNQRGHRNMKRATYREYVKSDISNYFYPSMSGACDIRSALAEFSDANAIFIVAVYYDLDKSKLNIRVKFNDELQSNVN